MDVIPKRLWLLHAIAYSCATIILGRSEMLIEEGGCCQDLFMVAIVGTVACMHALTKIIFFPFSLDVTNLFF